MPIARVNQLIGRCEYIVSDNRLFLVLATTNGISTEQIERADEILFNKTSNYLKQNTYSQVTVGVRQKQVTESE